jgi:hypothetical protein
VGGGEGVGVAMPARLFGINDLVGGCIRSWSGFAFARTVASGRRAPEWGRWTGTAAPEERSVPTPSRPVGEVTDRPTPPPAGFRRARAEAGGGAGCAGSPWRRPVWRRPEACAALPFPPAWAARSPSRRARAGRGRSRGACDRRASRERRSLARGGAASRTAPFLHSPSPASGPTELTERLGGPVSVLARRRATLRAGACALLFHGGKLQPLAGTGRVR